MHPIRQLHQIPPHPHTTNPKKPNITVSTKSSKRKRNKVKGTNFRGLQAAQPRQQNAHGDPQSSGGGAWGRPSGRDWGHGSPPKLPACGSAPKTPSLFLPNSSLKERPPPTPKSSKLSTQPNSSPQEREREKEKEKATAKGPKAKAWCFLKPFPFGFLLTRDHTWCHARVGSSSSSS